jgi:hypothetical protein
MLNWLRNFLVRRELADFDRMKKQVRLATDEMQREITVDRDRPARTDETLYDVGVEPAYSASNDEGHGGSGI